MFSSLPLTFESSYTIGIGVFVFYVAIKLGKAIYDAYFSSLARVPGPSFAALSNLWFEWHALRFRGAMAVHNAILRYGPVVRIGPKKVVVAALDDVRTIYKSHQFRKSQWYDAIRFGGVYNILSTPDPERHTILRRWSAPSFRKESLRAVSASMREVLHHFVDRIECESKGGQAIEVFHFFKLLSLDIFGVAVLGTQFNQMKTGTNLPLVQHLYNVVLDKALVNYLPGPLYQILHYVPSAALRRILAAEGEIYEMASRLYDSSVEDGTHVDLIASCKAYRDPTTNLAPPKNQVVAEATIFLIAGTDTASVVLTHIAWNLAREPQHWREIRRELATVTENQLHDYDVLKGLLYLNAFIKEVLRVHSPVGGPLERVVPPEGANFQGYFIPGGTIVTGQIWTTHRNETFFPDPFVVRPERWIQRSGDGWKERDVPPDVSAAWMPFLMGPRACVGRPLAEMELLLVTATLVRSFRITAHHSTTEESMSPVDMIVVGPASGRCLLHFTPDLCDFVKSGET